MPAAIFDLDGTLADSVPDIAAALNGALTDAGLAPFDVASVTNMVGAGARRLVERSLLARGAAPSRALADQVHGRFIAHYEAHPCVHTKLYPGARAALDELAGQGWRMGICTNKPEPLAVAVVAALGIAPLFGAVTGGRTGTPLKPAPDMIRLVLIALKSSPDDTVFIGDSAADLGAGRAAGLPVILMAHGYSDTPVATLGADRVVAGFEGFVHVLDKLHASCRASP